MINSLQDLLDMHLDEDGDICRPPRELIKNKLSEILEYVDRDFNDDAKLEEIVRVNGEENIKRQILELTGV